MKNKYQQIEDQINNQKFSSTGEMAQWLGTLATFPEEQSPEARCEGTNSLAGGLGTAWPAQQAPCETKERPYFNNKEGGN